MMTKSGKKGMRSSMRRRSQRLRKSMAVLMLPVPCCDITFLATASQSLLRRAVSVEEGRSATMDARSISLCLRARETAEA